MLITDLAVRRPAFAVVLSLLLLAFGALAFQTLQLRQYPDIDTPVISISTDYRGASAQVVETKITQPLEGRLSGIEGVKTISSRSSDGRSSITLDFETSRNIDDAANDVRDSIGGVVNSLPEEASPPQIRKSNSDDNPVIWLSLASDTLSRLEVTDYAERFVADRFSSIDGVARVDVSGGLAYSMKIWLERGELAARDLTVEDVSAALQRQNVELPAGSIQSTARDFTMRVLRSYRSEQQFRDLIIRRTADGGLVRLGDVARVEVAAEEYRNFFRSNGEDTVGLGIIKQSTGNLIEVSDGVKREFELVRNTLPPGLTISVVYNSGVFVDSAVREVYRTFFFAAVLVILTTYLFIGDWRATIIPAFALPISVIATFIALQLFGYSLNLITLLALILAIGLVIDDAIVVLENVYSRVESDGSPLVAAYEGSRQVYFAVIATSVILISVFTPITFLEGKVGKLFGEFAVALSAAIAFSSFVSLTLTPALCSRFLRTTGRPRLAVRVEKNMQFTRGIYRRLLEYLLDAKLLIAALCLLVFIAIAFVLSNLKTEFTPYEDRGNTFMLATGAQGASYEVMTGYMQEIEKRILPLIEAGEIETTLVRVPGYGMVNAYNTGLIFMPLTDWNSGRRDSQVIANDINRRTADITGVNAFTLVPKGVGLGSNAPVQFVIGGADYATLREWRDTILAEAAKNPGLVRMDHDHKETKPQMLIHIDVDRAGDLGVSTVSVSATLETFFGSRQSTTFLLNGEERNVILQGERDQRMQPEDIGSLYVRSTTSGELVPLSNLVTVEEVAEPESLNRFNRIRAITLTANLADDYSLGEALDYLRQLVREKLPPEVSIDYKGESLELVETSGSSVFIFAMALLIAYLVLVAQFESFLQPLVIMISIPLSVLGAVLALYVTDQTLNIYSQVALVMLVGLAAKNGVLIVEFINQKRDEGLALREAILEGSSDRLRPILMTAVTTAIGSIPLVFASGAGAESRFVIGIVIIAGTLVGSGLTLLVTPTVYASIAGKTRPPGHTGRQLDNALAARRVAR
jgi:multidrug efflux pump